VAQRDNMPQPPRLADDGGGQVPHGLIAKISRSRRWCVTDAGNLLLSAAVRLRVRDDLVAVRLKKPLGSG
jgi:hypothetical protein